MLTSYLTSDLGWFT